MANFKQKKFKSEAGNEFTFQFPGIRAVTKINDRVKNKYGIPQDEKVADEMLEHVIVEPKMSFDEFNSYAEFSEVIQAAYSFAIGNDTDDKSEGS